VGFHGDKPVASVFRVKGQLGVAGAGDQVVWVQNIPLVLYTIL